jgi:DNA-binding XRE family transcriptional regulator
MNPLAFQAFRQQLGKTQKQLSELLGASLKAIQSFEQGWRKVPVHIERQILFLLALQNHKARESRSCWEIRSCPPETRNDCPAWEFKAGNLCWFINGTICQGKPQASWSAKMTVCWKCEVFRNNVGMFASGKNAG